MSNNLVSQQFPVPDRQMMEIHASDKPDMPSDVEMRVVGHSPSTPALHEFAVSHGEMGFMKPLVSSSGSHNAALSTNQIEQMDPRLGSYGSQQLPTPNQQFGEVGSLLNNAGAHISPLPTKRKAEVEPMGNLSVSQQSSMPNKRAAQTGTLPDAAGFWQPIATSKKGVQMQQPKLTSPTMQNQNATKKMMRNDSGKTSSQRVQTPKGRTVQIESNSRVSTESTEAVRAKMRESVAAALELACQSPDKSVIEEKNKTESASHQIPGSSLPPESEPDASGAGSDTLEKNQNPLQESSHADRSTDGQRSNVGLPTSENVAEFQCNSLLSTDDYAFTDNFFIKDELLQGNGLSWAWDLDMASRGSVEGLNDVKPVMVDDDIGGDKGEQAKPSPQELAFKIEEELFKLFGGVNKKYKEKGRSLLFNLKDRNNPELREKVMSGEISPERLCSMTAEELASKELSEWRTAKAEEFAQMVVLPDTDVNMRRLVKKTHKGEYQVEVERNDDVVNEVITGTSSIIQLLPKEKNKALPPENDMKDKENATTPKGGGEKQKLPERLVIPNDEADLMQGMIVDEMKDPEFLPPIVSLDEFMESLDSEPPFESLPEDAGLTTPLSDKKNSESSQKSVTSDVSSRDLVDNVSGKAKEEVQEHVGFNAVEKSKQSAVAHKVAAPESTSLDGCVWQGSLQLNISSSVLVAGVFRSGEKTPTHEWPASLEVKGRVRLDAFEKFLQELPKSRSRAVMVLHFLLKDSTSENERANLTEAVDSYALDERLGFAEPAPGVELYLCPPQGRSLDMLTKHLSKDRTEILNSTDNGLIGVLVWRKAHLTSTTTTISPNSSSHHKNSLKRQNLASSRRQNERDANVNGNSMMPKGPVVSSYAQPRLNPPPEDDDDDDIPPGFGPGAPRDDDDLPEFNFSGNVNQSVNRFPSQNISHPPRIASVDQSRSNRQVDQMRELVQKYGQTSTTAAPPITNGAGAVGLGLEPWDDDDDIPEWRPQPLQPPAMHNFQHPMRPHGGIMHPPPGIGQHLPRHVAMHDAMPQPWQQSGRWEQPSRPVSLGNQHAPRQPHPGMPARPGRGKDWRQGPRSRAF